MYIGELLGDCTTAEQHDAVGDPHRHDLGKGRSAQQGLAWLTGAGENAERAGAVPKIGQWPAGLVSRIVGSTVIDEIAGDVRTQALRQSMMVWIVTGVEVRNPNVRRTLRPADRRDGGIEL